MLCFAAAALIGWGLAEESAAYATPKAAEASPSPLQKGRGLGRGVARCRLARGLGHNSAEYRADWLSVGAPRRAAAGQRLLRRVHWAPLSEPGVLGVDLRRWASRDTTMGYLAAGGLKPLRKEGGTSGYLPPSAIPRRLTGLLLLAATLIAWGAGLSANDPPGVPSIKTRAWQVMVLLLALACLWELFGLESWLGARGRAIARAADLYDARAAFQKIVISMAVAGTLLCLFFVRRARRSRRLLLVSFVIYLMIAGVNLVSWHTIDQVADLSWQGLTFVQALKLGCATMILEGLRRARRAY